MNIPPEIAEEMGWVPGDVLKIEILDSGVSISKVTNG
jgi:bifunctional DNA-binding transcriptional regulator/antitoxin component of YhaV-PrlF toxin-antitoxin module